MGAQQARDGRVAVTFWLSRQGRDSLDRWRGGTTRSAYVRMLLAEEAKAQARGSSVISPETARRGGDHR
jgi:hypothetical protein